MHVAGSNIITEYGSCFSVRSLSLILIVAIRLWSHCLMRLLEAFDALSSFVVICWQ